MNELFSSMTNLPWIGEDSEYQKLEKEFLRDFELIKGVMENFEEGDSEIRDATRNGLLDAVDLYKEAKKSPNKEAPETIEKMRKAADSAIAVLDNVLRFYFEKACAARKFFKGHEDLAFQCIDNYRETHSKSLSEIEGFLSGNTKLTGDEISHCIEDIQDFLKDFKTGKPGLSDAIKEKEEEKKAKEEAMKKNPDNRGFWSRILEGVLIFVAGSIILSILCTLGGLVIKSCVLDTSSTQPAQPETEQQSATNNSTPTP